MSQISIDRLVSSLASSNELITNPQLKFWIKSNKDKLPGVAINENAGIDNTKRNLKALAKIEALECSNYLLNSIDELIRHMPNLKKLECNDNCLIELDLSNNINLIELHCHNNQLTSLDLSKNINLDALFCHKNQLKHLNVTNNINLLGLACFENKLNNLDLSKNIDLTLLGCHENQLTSLDLSKNINLELLHCSNNQLTSLDISSLPNLEELQCCNLAEGFILYLTNEQKDRFTKEDYYDAILEIKE